MWIRNPHLVDSQHVTFLLNLVLDYDGTASFSMITWMYLICGCVNMKSVYLNGHSEQIFRADTCAMFCYSHLHSIVTTNYQCSDMACINLLFSQMIFKHPFSNCWIFLTTLVPAQWENVYGKSWKLFAPKNHLFFLQFSKQHTVQRSWFPIIRFTQYSHSKVALLPGKAQVWQKHTHSPISNTAREPLQQSFNHFLIIKFRLMWHQLINYFEIDSKWYPINRNGIRVYTVNCALYVCECGVFLSLLERAYSPCALMYANFQWTQIRTQSLACVHPNAIFTPCYNYCARTEYLCTIYTTIYVLQHKQMQIYNINPPPK